MKKRRRVMHRHVNPHAILVGYSGKIGCDERLLPLRMTKKYKNVLKREESERNEKILQMSQLIEKYRNLSCIIDNVRKENENNENSSFLLELQGEKKRYSERLLFLESELDHDLPDILKTSMHVMFSRNAKHSKNRSPPQWKKTSYVNKKRVLTGQNRKESLSNSLPEKKPHEKFGRKFTNSSMSGSVKSQILVKDQFSNLHKISIDLFSNGENLLQVLATELGEELEKNCNVTFRTKKVEKEMSLYEQGIYHGSIVNLDLKLHGGMKSKKKKQKKKESNMLSAKSKDNNPGSWTRAQVKNWFANICKDLNIEEEKVSQLTSMNGKGLNLLLKEEWLRQSPDLGDFLFKKWNDLNREHSNEQISGADIKEEKKSESMQGIFDRTARHKCSNKNVSFLKRKRNTLQETVCGYKKRVMNKQEIQEKNRAVDEALKENFPLPEKLEEDISEDEAIPAKSSYFGSVKSQLLIRDCNSKVETISIDLFSNGRNLQRVLRSQFGGELKNYSVRFGSKKVIKRKSLYGQGVTHGATLELSDRLGGGMERQEQQDNKSPNTTDFPEKWKKLQVGNWIDGICEEFEIEKADVSDLKTLNGKGLNKLSEKDWIRRSPKQGDLFYKMWMDLKKEKSSGEPDSNEPSVPPDQKRFVTVPEERLLGTTLLSVSPASEGGNTEAQANERVDSDDHGLVYMETEALLSRQQSQPSSTYIYPATFDGKRLNVGDFIKKTNKRVFCKGTASNDKIRKFVVAFKNSFAGDIFVGVEKSGEITGMEGTRGQHTHWREEMGKTIGNIPPGTTDLVSFCENDEDAKTKIGKECFISVMELGDCKSEVGKVSVIAWIHVPKGLSAPVYFLKEIVIPAFFRVGAETKRINNLWELFSRIKAAKSREIKLITMEDITKKVDQTLANMKELSHSPVEVFKVKQSESNLREFKMIFGNDPVKIINSYVAMYCCGFLNSEKGTIHCGVQEDVETKVGHVIGIVISGSQRKFLIRKSFNVLSNFYPPVNLRWVSMWISTVSVPPDWVFKYPKTYKKIRWRGECVLLNCLPKFVSIEWPKLSGKFFCRFIRVSKDTFCIVGKDLKSEPKEFMGIVETFQKRNNIRLDMMLKSHLKQVLKNLCVVEIQVFSDRDRGPYSFYMTEPIKTYCFNDQGKLLYSNIEKLLDSNPEKPIETSYNCDFQKFLDNVDHFNPSGNSYIMVLSPFNLPPLQRDQFGLVIPKCMTLVIDFDQDPEEEGHFFQTVQNLHDCSLVTPDDNLDLKAHHGICWLATRGHSGIETSRLECFADWNKSRGKKIPDSVEQEITRNGTPNKLHIVIFWDEGHRNLMFFLKILLADILSINGNKAVTFVCTTREAYLNVSESLIKELKNCFPDTPIDENVFSLEVLANDLACGLRSRSP